MSALYVLGRPRTTDADAARFLDRRRYQRVHAVEARWLERIQRARLHLYRMPEETFVEDDEVAGYWASHATVEPLEMITTRDLIGRHTAAGIPLRTEMNLWPL